MMPPSDMPRYDIFLSYKHEDCGAVQQLKDELEQRGATPFLDTSALDPGLEWSPQIFRAIEGSRAFALMVSQKSLASQWVQAELKHALKYFEQGAINVIPVMLEDVPLPDLPQRLASHQAIYLNHDPDQYQSKVDRLVYPGITRKHIECVAILGRGHYSEPWRKLADVVRHEGIHFIDATDPGRAEYYVNAVLSKPNVRLVVFADLFEERPAPSVPKRPGYPAQIYANLILSTRERAKETRFILFQHSAAWNALHLELDPAAASTLKPFFSLDQDAPLDALRWSFREKWNRVQYELMTKFERV